MNNLCENLWTLACGHLAMHNNVDWIIYRILKFKIQWHHLILPFKHYDYSITLLINNVIMGEVCCDHITFWHLLWPDHCRHSLCHSLTLHTLLQYQYNRMQHTKNSQVTFIYRWIVQNCFIWFDSQSSAITWFHRIKRIDIVFGAPKWKPN